jgi:hypothetical protein
MRAEHWGEQPQNCAGIKITETNSHKDGREALEEPGRWRDKKSVAAGVFVAGFKCLWACCVNTPGLVPSLQLRNVVVHYLEG